MPASAIIPAYQAADSIAATVGAVRRIPGVEQIIVVDDGSRDATAERAGAAGADTVIRLAHNRGKGGALRAGLDAATSDELLLLDADLADSAVHAGPLLSSLEGESAMAVAVLPTPPRGEGGGLGLTLQLAHGVIRLLAGFSPAAPMSGQRAIPRAVLDHLGIAPRFGVEVALTTEAAHVGLPIREICLPLQHRHTGRTAAGFLHRGRQFRDVAVFLFLNGFGLGWPALSRAATFVRVALWAAALALVVSLGGLAAPPLSVRFAVACIAALILWLPCLWLGAVVLGVRRANYLGRRLPAASGILFALVAVPFLWLTGAVDSLRLSGCIVMAALMIVGLIDDLYAGGRQARGLRGHLGALARGRVTTGAVKAAGGLAAGIAAGVLLHPGDPVRIAFDALLVALGANLINLLDLRPGRALKAFGLLSGAVIALEPNSLRLLGPLLGAAVVSAPSDLAGRTMMGDTGSNVLGGALGLALASSLPLGGCVAAVAALLAIHLHCERVSLTDVIGRSRALQFLDRLGTAHLPPLPAGGEVTE